MYMSSRHAVGISLFALFLNTAQAGLITYDENINGDLSFASPPTFTFDTAGANTITGRMVLPDLDNFNLVVPSGIVVSNLMLNTTEGAVAFQLATGQSTVIDVLSDTAGGGGDSLISGALPLGPGNYRMTVAGASGDPNAYTLTFAVVNQIPEPASFALLSVGLGVVGLAVIRRKCC